MFQYVSQKEKIRKYRNINPLYYIVPCMKYLRTSFHLIHGVPVIEIPHFADKNRWCSEWSGNLSRDTQLVKAIQEPFLSGSKFQVIILASFCILTVKEMIPSYAKKAPYGNWEAMFNIKFTLDVSEAEFLTFCITDTWGLNSWL